MGTSLAVIEKELTARLPNFAGVVPRDLPAERIVRTVMVSCERNPRLLDCTQQSIMNSAMTAAVLGLEVDGVTGQGFLIPYKLRDMGETAQFQIGYKGYNTMAARAGITINGGVVREGDGFDYMVGTGGYVKHKPQLANPNGRKIIGAWATAEAMGRPPIVAVMGYDELLAVKAKSPGAKRSDSPWNDNGVGHAAMCEKTVKRRLARSMPLTVMTYAAALEDQHDMGHAAYLRPDGAITVDGQAIYPDRQPQPQLGSDVTQPARFEWQMADGSFKSWPTIDLWASALCQLIEKQNDPANLLSARTRNGALMAEYATAGFADQVMTVQAAFDAKGATIS